MKFAVGDRFRIPAGTGTQLAEVMAVVGEFVYLRRYRVRSNKWNVKPDKYHRDNLHALLVGRR
jgi:hypothetical protein